MKNIEINEVYTLFEEIKELIKKANNNNTVIQPQIDMPDLSVINDLTDKLDKVIEETHKPVRMEHHHIFSIASKKVFFGVLGICLVCILCLFTIFKQREEISSYKDNDLKYRYIKTQGDITPQKLRDQENTFENKRDSVQVIRKEVNKYEKALIEEAKRLEKVRLKEQEAERLKLEAERLKQGK